MINKNQYMVRLLVLIIGFCPYTLYAQTASKSFQSHLYDVQPVSVPSGQSFGAVGMNNSGQVVGSMTVEESHKNYMGNSRPFLWKSNDTVPDPIGTMPGYRDSYPISINDTGRVLAFATNATDGPIVEKPFFYKHGRKSFLAPFAKHRIDAVAQNNQGLVVGRTYVSTYVTHAALWNNDSLKDLGTLGGKQSSAHGINDQGDIVGQSQTVNGHNHAFLWHDGKMQDIGTLGGRFSTAYAINKSKQIVGEAQTASGETHAFLWQNGRMTDLGTLGGHGSNATSINDAGQIVGASETAKLHEDGMSYVWHGFLYEHNHLFDLNSLIVKRKNWTLVNALQITNAGKILAKGDINNTSQGWMLTQE